MCDYHLAGFAGQMKARKILICQYLCMVFITAHLHRGNQLTARWTGQLCINASFPALPVCIRSSISVSPCSVSKLRKNYIFFHKNSIAYVKNNILRCRKFAASVLPTIYMMQFYFFRIRSVHCTNTATALWTGSSDTIT